MKTYIKSCQSVHFSLKESEYNSLQSFNWYFTQFENFLNNYDISVFKNDGTMIQIVFVSEQTLSTSFVEKMINCLLKDSQIWDADEYEAYLKVCLNEATLNELLSFKNSKTRKTKL